MLTKRKLREMVVNMDASDFNSDVFFTDQPWYFSQDGVCSYESFRTQIGKVFRVPKNNIALVGSGCLGFSMSPMKNLRKFTKESDLDVVVISPDHFIKVWSVVLKTYYAGYPQVKEDFAPDIFRRFVTLYKLSLIHI